MVGTVTREQVENGACNLCGTPLKEGKIRVYRRSSGEVRVYVECRYCWHEWRVVEQ